MFIKNYKMKTLIIFLLLSNIAISQTNHYLESKLYNESKKQAIAGIVILSSMFMAQHATKGTKLHPKVITIGITLSITNIAYYAGKKRKIRHRFNNRITFFNKN